MAAGDMIVFNQTRIDIGNGVHNFGTHTFNLALLTSAVTPTITTPDPRWGAGGGTNYMGAQVPLGTAYAGPVSLAGKIWSLVGNEGILKVSDVIINKDDIQGFSNARWALVYNNTIAGKNALFAADLGADRTNVIGPVQITINPTGLLALR